MRKSCIYNACLLSICPRNLDLFCNLLYKTDQNFLDILMRTHLYANYIYYIHIQFIQFNLRYEVRGNRLIPSLHSEKIR